MAAGLVMALASCITVDAPPDSTVSAAPTVTTGAAAPPTSTTTTTLAAPAPTTSTTRAEETELPPIPPCLTPEPPFGEEGEIERYSVNGSDSALLANVDWHTWEECERFAFSMASPEGAPTLVPPSALVVMFREHGILRLHLGVEVETSAVSYQTVDSPLVDRFYVLKSPGGGVQIDLHLAQPAVARMIPGSGPATLTVDLRPGGGPFARSPVITSRVVLLLPEGDRFQYPFAMAGYLPPGTEEYAVTLTGLDRQITETGFPLRGGDDLWLGFTAVFPDGPRGWTTMQVEDVQARLFFGE